MIKEMREERKKLMDRVRDIDKAISAFQKVCHHKFESSGHDSHYSYEECSICGYEIKV